MDETTPRVSRVRIVAAGVAALVLAGAIVFAVLATGDHGSAVRERKRAEQLLERQRAETQQTQADLESLVGNVEYFDQAVATPLATGQNLATLEDQGVQVEQAVQSAGLSGSVDDYNNEIDQANALVAQYNAAIDALNQQMQALPPLPATRAPGRTESIEDGRE
jgi:hypothetical protein